MEQYLLGANLEKTMLWFLQVKHCLY